jgi:radical SAM superfamily enzyme YgiQ (UPF0313 family)
MTRKKLLFIHPGSNQATRDIEEKHLMLGGTQDSIELSFAYLDSYLKEKLPDIETSYLDFRFNDPSKTMKELLDVEQDFNFTHVAMTCYSRHFLQAREIAKNIKEIDPRIPVIVGGFHPTVRPSDFQGDGVPVDYIIRGEGEVPLYQVMKDDGLPRIQKVLCHDRPIDINASPLINLDLYKEYKKELNFKNLYVYFSRGCIHECVFCAGRKETCNMKAYRTLSPARAREQLQVLEKHEPSKIIVQDPIFGVSGGWFNRVVDMLGSRDRECDVHVEMHADLASKSRLNALASNGINLTVGFESAAPAMLALMRKTRDPATYVKNMEKIIAHFKDKDQLLTINTLVLHPGETGNTLDHTFDFLKDNTRQFHHAIVKVSFFRLYPGTPVYHMLDELEKSAGTRIYCKDWWLHDIDHSTSPCLVDPSKDLDFFGGIERVEQRVKDLVVNGITRSKNVPVPFKIGSLRFLKNVEKTRENLIDHVKDLAWKLGKKR